MATITTSWIWADRAALVLADVSGKGVHAALVPVDRASAGDLLVIFSDGDTEAVRGDEEFGEERLIGELLRLKDAPADAVVSPVLARVQEFSGGAQSDDLTLLVARGT